MRIFLFCMLLCFNQLSKATYKKPWTVMVYMSARNDLAPFSLINLQQMQLIGSNANVSIVVRLNTVQNNINVAHTLLIKKNETIKLAAPISSIDGASVDNITDFCQYVIENFPAEHYACFFWDHGTGILTPNNSSCTQSPFSLHYATTKSLLAKDIYKGVCFDDTSQNCLSDSDIHTALGIICNKYLNKKKLDIVGFDACYMAMLEVAYTLAPFADYMIASQEVEPGAGWDYEKVFSLFAAEKPTPSHFVQHIVNVYKKNYPTETLTLSGIDLRYIPALTNATSFVAHYLEQALFLNNEVFKKNLLKNRKNPIAQRFYSKSPFIDLLCFYKNMLHNIERMLLEKEDVSSNMLCRIKKILLIAVKNLQNCVIANSSKNSKNFSGLSIYLPQYSIHASYQTTNYCKKTYWVRFIDAYIECKHDQNRRIQTNTLRQALSTL